MLRMLIIAMIAIFAMGCSSQSVPSLGVKTADESSVLDAGLTSDATIDAGVYVGIYSSGHDAAGSLYHHQQPIAGCIVSDYLRAKQEPIGTCDTPPRPIGATLAHARGIAGPLARPGESMTVDFHRFRLLWTAPGHLFRAPPTLLSPWEGVADTA